MATIAVLGMGLLGRGFAEHALEQGHTVAVWNRTASKCGPVVAKGARQGETPADAVRGAERVHLVLAEDGPVDAVVAQLREGLGSGVPIIDHSTNRPDRVKARAETLAAANITYLHAPVFMGPTNSRQGTGLMLISGPAAPIDALLEPLKGMTGLVKNYGEAPDAAAKMKLIGNALLLLLTGSMGDLYALGQGMGLDPAQVLSLFELFTPSPQGMGKRILASATAPVGFEMTMARKDARLMIESAREGSLTLLPAMAAALDAGIAAGRGAEDFTAIARPGTADDSVSTD